MIRMTTFKECSLLSFYDSKTAQLANGSCAKTVELRLEIFG